MAAAAAVKKQPGNDIIVTTAIELVAVGVFGVLAGMSDSMGSVMVVFMWGLVIGFMLLHTTQLGSIVKDL
jgi:hypothetical protein